MSTEDTLCASSRSAVVWAQLAVVVLKSSQQQHRLKTSRMRVVTVIFRQQGPAWPAEPLPQLGLAAGRQTANTHEYTVQKTQQDFSFSIVLARCRLQSCHCLMRWFNGGGALWPPPQSRLNMFVIVHTLPKSLYLIAINRKQVAEIQFKQT